MTIITSLAFMESRHSFRGTCKADTCSNNLLNRLDPFFYDNIVKAGNWKSIFRKPKF